MRRKLSWKPDIPDIRDYSIDKMGLDRYGVSPSAVNLRRWCSAVEDQGVIGSCTANAIVGMLEYNRNRKGIGGVNLSRLFLYYNERVLGENIYEDTGAYLRDGVKTAALNGVCRSDVWPYRVNYWKARPPMGAYVDGLNYTVSRYYRLQTLEDMKTTLANGHVFVFGFAVYDSFMSDQVAYTGIVPMPTTSERLLGGHAVMACGYDDSTQMFLIRNSWSRYWGIQEGNLGGYCYMPYTYLADRNLSDDFWTITL